MTRLPARARSATNLDLNDLVVFVEVVGAKSLTTAAVALDLPKSTVSRRLAQLEERLGVRLIQRTTRRFALTEIGETYYQRCATILAEISNANKDVTDMQATPRGKLRITAPADLSTGYMGRIISEFCATHADIRVELTVTDRFVDAFLAACAAAGEPAPVPPDQG